MKISDEPPARQERAPSPPPAYDEVTKPAEVSKTDNASISDVKIDFGCSESPPDYELAMAMSRADYLVYEVSKYLKTDFKKFTTPHAHMK